MQTVDIERIRKSEPWDGLELTNTGRKAVQAKHSIEHMAEMSANLVKEVQDDDKAGVRVVAIVIAAIIGAPSILFVGSLLWFGFGGK